MTVVLLSMVCGLNLNQLSIWGLVDLIGMYYMLAKNFCCRKSNGVEL